MKKNQPKFALLILDVFSEFDFPKGNNLLKALDKNILNILKLKHKFVFKKYPIIYINDTSNYNYNKWADLISQTTKPQSKGRSIALSMLPEPHDIVMLKNDYSAFHKTNLDKVLKKLKVKNLIIVGVSANICILSSTLDALMLNYKVWVPQNCIASTSEAETKMAIQYFKKILKIKTAKFQSSIY